MSSLHISACVNNVLWERIYVLFDHILSEGALKDKERKDFCDGDFDSSGFEIVSHRDLDTLSEGDQVLRIKKVKFQLVLNFIEFSYFMYLLQTSNVYRSHVIKYWTSKSTKNIPKSKNLTLYFTLVDPHQQILDFKWCHRITNLVMERSELDNAMSWFSTLGGAYSALGDEFSHCAEMAGRISFRQFDLALRLGDPSTVARCKLYIALSLIQTFRFKYARKIIETQHQLAVNSTCPDTRLVRMCRGVWSKLRYERSRYFEKKKMKRGLTA